MTRYRIADDVAWVSHEDLDSDGVPSAYVTRRRDFILDQMRRLGGPDYLHELGNPTAPPKARPSREQPPKAGDRASK